MGTKVKGFFIGLKNISNIFNEGQEEPKIQIGMPTDVKHVAHIGADGPATESPSWMNKFAGRQSQSGPLDMTLGESLDIRKGTNNHRVSRSEEITRDLPDKPKPSRHRRRSMDSSQDPDSQQKKHKRRRHRIRGCHEKGDESRLPDIPKKSRRKKSKEDDGSTKSRDSESSNTEPQLDP